MIHTHMIKKISLIAIMLMMGFLSMGKVEAAACNNSIDSRYLGGWSDSCCVDIIKVYGQSGWPTLSSLWASMANWWTDNSPIAFCDLPNSCIDFAQTSFGAIGEHPQIISQLNSINTTAWKTTPITECSVWIACNQIYIDKYNKFLKTPNDNCCMDLDLLKKDAVLRNNNMASLMITASINNGPIWFCSFEWSCIEETKYDMKWEQSSWTFLNNINQLNASAWLPKLIYCEDKKKEDTEQICKDKRWVLYDVVNWYDSTLFNRGTCCLTTDGEKKLKDGANWSVLESNDWITQVWTNNPATSDGEISLNSSSVFPTTNNTSNSAETTSVNVNSLWYSQADIDAVDWAISCVDACEPEWKWLAEEWSEEKCQEWYTLDQATCQCKQDCDPETCNCGIKLLTRVPFIGKCIQFSNVNDAGAEWSQTTTVNALNAFPLLAGALAKIAMTVLLLLSFATLIVAWVLMTLSGAAGSYDRGKKLLIKVVIAFALLGTVGAILNAINPNFFLS